MSLFKIVSDKNSLISGNVLVTPYMEEWYSTANRVYDPKIMQMLEDAFLKGQRRRSGTWSASSMGYCQRQQVLRYISTTPSNEWTRNMIPILEHGGWVHAKWQAIGITQGWLKDYEVPGRAPELNLSCTFDGILTSGQGWELKSANDNSYKWVKRMQRPEPKHIRQIHAYMIASGKDAWSLVYENKNDQNYIEFVIHRDPEIEASVIKELVDQAEAVDTETLPPVLEDCSHRKGATYNNCQFHDICLEMTTWPNQRLLSLTTPSALTTE